MRFHDRFTNGIPGLLPLVLDLPVRFTDSPNKKAKDMGVFKHSRGWLRGWELSEAETKRLEELADPEVVLFDRPLRLYIEVETANKTMPLLQGKRIYTLAVQARQWSIDPANKVKAGWVIDHRVGVNTRCENYCLVSEYCDQFKVLQGF